MALVGSAEASSLPSTDKPFTQLQCTSENVGVYLFVNNKTSEASGALLVAGQAPVVIEKSVHTIVGAPMTRLTGITWYQMGLFENPEIDVLVSTDSNEEQNGVEVHSGHGEVVIDGKTTYLSCIAF